MQAVKLPTQFVQGFVKACAEAGCTLEQTEELFRIHSNNCLLAQPHIQAGFQEKLASSDELSGAQAAHYLSPDILSLAVDCQVKYASDPLSEEMRRALDMPEPSWDTVDPEIQKVAASLSSMFDTFDAMPMNQKVLLSALAGGGLGMTSRVLSPTGEDQLLDRGAFNRGARGMLRGGGVGVGAATGAAAGSDLAGRFSPDMRLSGSLLGGLLGGMAGGRLANDVVR
jgi:hypothetical protein